MLFRLFFLFGLMAKSEEMLESLNASESVLKRCVEETLKLFGKKRSIYAYKNEYDFSDVLYTYQWPYVIINLEHNLEDLRRLNVYEFYMIAIDEINSLDNFLSHYYKTRYYNSQAPTLILFSGPRESLQEILNVLWKYYLVNVLIILKDLGMYTYYPLTQGGCTSSTPVFVSTCDEYVFENAARHLESENLYYDMCELRIYANNLPPYVMESGYEENTGLELMILKEIVYRTKLKPVFHLHNYSDWGEKLPNGSYSSMLGKLHNKEADVVLGMISFDETLIKDFSSTLIYCFTRMSFFVPVAKPIKPWMNIFLIFDNNTWYTTLFTLILTSTLWFFIKHNNKQPWIYDILFFFNMLVSTVSNKPKEWRLKYFFIIWAFFSLIITTSYQSPMVAFLFKPNYEKQISTLEDLVVSNLKVGGHRKHRLHFNVSHNSVLKKIYDNWEFCSFHGEECLTKLFELQNFGYYRNARSIMYYESRNRINIYRINHEFIIFATMYVNKASPLLRRMDEIILRLFQAGLIFKWDEYTSSHLPKLVATGASALRFEHILGAMIVYTVGLSLALVVFLLEILIYIFRRH